MFGTGWNETSLGLKEFILSQTIKTSRTLPAGESNTPPVTWGNRRQSLPAETFACFSRLFYLRNTLPAAIAGKDAGASFTVYNRKVPRFLRRQYEVTGCEVIAQHLQRV